MGRFALRAALVFVLAPSFARGAVDTVNGAIYCNETRVEIRSSVAVWQPKERTLSLYLFDSRISAEVRDHWAKSSSSVIPQGMSYVAKLEIKLAKGATLPTREALESYLLYVDCPATQLNVNRSIFTDPKRMFRDFPVFEGTLESGGVLRVTAREPERVKLMTTSTEWDLEIETTVSVR